MIESPSRHEIIPGTKRAFRSGNGNVSYLPSLPDILAKLYGSVDEFQENFRWAELLAWRTDRPEDDSRGGGEEAASKRRRVSTNGAHLYNAEQDVLLNVFPETFTQMRGDVWVQVGLLLFRAIWPSTLCPSIGIRVVRKNNVKKVIAAIFWSGILDIITPSNSSFRRILSWSRRNEELLGRERGIAGSDNGAMPVWRRTRCLLPAATSISQDTKS